MAVSLDGELLPGCPFLVEVRDPEDEDLGEEEDAVSNKRASTRVKSSTTTTTTTTVTTRSVNGAVVTDTRRSRGEWTEETYVDEAGVERVRRVRVKSEGSVSDGGSDGGSDSDSADSRMFAFGGGGLKPSAAASERAARSLSGMSAGVAAQALADMRPAAGGAVLARMDPQTAGGVIDAMAPAVAAAAVCAMEAEEAIAALAQCPRETRVAVLEAMTPPQLGAYLSAMSAEGAADVLRELSLVWSNAGVEHMVSRRAAAALAQLPEDRLLEALVGVRSERAAPILEALCEEGGVQDGAALAARAVAALCKRSPDKCAAHVAAMVDVAMRGSERASPARGAPSRTSSRACPGTRRAPS